MLLFFIVFLFPIIMVQKLYDELLHYRKEYVSASEKLCASRHISNLPDVSASVFVCL